MRRAFLIAGAEGMLGSALRRVLAERAAAGEPVRFVAPPKAEFDITSPSNVEQQVGTFAAGLAPDERGVLVNAAAYTNVDRAEDEPDLARRVNAEAPGRLASAARAAGLGFVHVSTDFVFDGEKTGAYAETDEPNPLSVYGATKLAGEKAATAADPGALVVRTAWVYGAGGANFPNKILARARAMGELTVVTDEVGSPTYSVDLAAGIVALVGADARPGVYHLAGGGAVSRYDFARAIVEAAGVAAVLKPVSSADVPAKAHRPRNSVLDTGKAAGLGVRLPAWEDGLMRFLATRDVGA